MHTSTHYLGVHEPAGGAAARARIIIQIQRSIPRLSAQQHETMVVRPLVGMTGDGVATLELRRTHQSTCARVQNGAQQVLVEGTRRAVPIGTSSSSFLQSITRLVSRLPLLGVPFLAARTSAGRKGVVVLLQKVRCADRQIDR